MFRWLVRGLATLILVALGLFWLAFCSPRPPLTTDPATLAGDGSAIDYCELPVLDGSGALAADIPKGNTPGCAYRHFPLPVLAACTEPLAGEAQDIRGLWIGVAGDHVGHVERVEQCGDRTVITTAGIIHDYGPNSTLGLNTNDTEGAVLFSTGDRDYCPRTSASMVWRDGKLDFRPFGWGCRGAALPGRRAARVGVRGRQRHAHGAHLQAAGGAPDAAAPGPAHPALVTVPAGRRTRIDQAAG